MTHPDPRIVDAHRYLDDATDILARGLPVGDDYLMRALIAIRDRLGRHQPDPHLDRCSYCGRPWLCPDVLADLNVLQVDLGWHAGNGN